MTQINFDTYLVDCLLPDLVGHDRRLTSFIVYLYLYRHATRMRTGPFAISHQSIATATGLSRSAGPDRLGTPSGPRTHRDFTCSSDRRSPPPRHSPWLRLNSQRS